MVGLIHHHFLNLGEIITAEKYRHQIDETHKTDLSPTDYHFFKRLDNFLQENIFKNRDSDESAVR